MSSRENSWDWVESSASSSFIFASFSLLVSSIPSCCSFVSSSPVVAVAVAGAVVVVDDFEDLEDFRDVLSDSLVLVLERGCCPRVVAARGGVAMMGFVVVVVLGVLEGGGGDEVEGARREPVPRLGGFLSMGVMVMETGRLVCLEGELVAGRAYL